MPHASKEQRKIYNKNRYERRQAFLRAYKLESGCVDCGYAEHHAGLEFDHIEKKTFHIGAYVTCAMDKLLAELAKCEVRCGTCHNVVTWERSRRGE